MSWNFGSLIPEDKPYRVELRDPEGKLIKDKAGVAAYIDVWSDDSAVGQKYDKERRAALLADIKSGNAAANEPLNQRDENIKKCAALTCGWYLIDPETLERIDVPCNRDSAEYLYSKPLMTALWTQVWGSALNHANFTKPSAPTSTPTQSGPSETAEG